MPWAGADGRCSTLDGRSAGNVQRREHGSRRPPQSALDQSNSLNAALDRRRRPRRSGRRDVAETRAGAVPFLGRPPRSDPKSRICRPLPRAKDDGADTRIVQSPNRLRSIVLKYPFFSARSALSLGVEKKSLSELDSPTVAIFVRNSASVQHRSAAWKRL